MVSVLAAMMEQWKVGQMAAAMVQLKAVKMDTWTAAWKEEL